MANRIVRVTFTLSGSLPSYLEASRRYAQIGSPLSIRLVRQSESSGQIGALQRDHLGQSDGAWSEELPLRVPSAPVG